MPAIPWQYNVINIDVDTKTCIVRKSRKEKELGSWMADSRWGDRVASQKIRNSF